MGALLSFFGGSAFRMIWGEVSHWFTAQQEHKQELARIKAQAEIDQQTFSNNLIQIKTQADLGVREIKIKQEAAQEQADADTFLAAIKDADKPSGIAWIDGWNKAIRPAFATVALCLWVANLYEQQWVMAGFDLDLFGSIVGFFFADRSLRHRGK
jgi:DNA-binding protein YbaB